MGILTRLLEKRAHPASDVDWGGWFGRGVQTNAGVDVTPDVALTYAAYYACIRVISETIATLPLMLYRRNERGKDRAPDHPLYRLVHDTPNPWMTSVEYRETKLAHTLAWGNAYSEIEYNGAGRPVALWPLRPDRMTVAKQGRELRYLYDVGAGQINNLPAWRVHHLRGLGNDGIVGYSPVRIAMQAIGLGLGTEEYGARFFGNGARPGLILRHPGKLSQPAAERLKASFAEEHQGLSKAHRTKVLEEGMDISTIGIPPEEAQFLETRKFQALEIARIFRVPPHMIGDLDRATFSNIEEQSLNFVIYTLRPWLVRDEQRLTADLLSDAERKSLLVEYLVDGLLRGNIQARYQAYNTAINAGFFTRNEVRELENKNPLEGLDEPLVPLNMMEVGSEPPAPAPAQGSQGGQEEQPAQRKWHVVDDREWRAVGADRRALIKRNVRLFEDATGRAVKREVADIRRAVSRTLGKRSAGDFRQWLEGFYSDMRGWLPEYYRAIMETYAETIMAAVAAELGGEPAEMNDDLREWITRYLDNFTAVYAVGSHKQLNALLAEAEDEEAAEAAINERLDAWEENKAAKTGLDQAVEAGNALAVLGYTLGGVSFLRWAASGESCPLCQKMDGRRIPISGAFFDEGDKLEADGVDPLPIIRKIRHAPLHGGCDCSVVAG